MELIVITTLCIVFSIMPTPCASHQIQVQPSHEQVQNLQLYLPTLPRKLRLIDETTLKGHGGKEFASYNKQKGALSDKLSDYKEREMMHPRRGTWQEIVERPDDMSQFFTMDYSNVRRRRPIHNKFVPVGP